MALTKIRAEQISDIDFKQAVRVVATTNVTLTNGAVDTIDSVLLAVSDRVLVTAQSTASQNGLYRVSVLGTGANGTWVRSSDGDATGDMSAGMLVSVTEGTVYKDTQWQLTTDNPIVLATTSLVFARTSSGGGSYTAGTGLTLTGSAFSVNVAQTQITSVGTLGSLAVTGNITSGNMNVIGNISGSNVTTTGLITATGNITGGNLLTGGIISATGNITGNYIIGNGSQLTGIAASYGNANVVANLAALGSNPVSTTGNITGNYFIGNGSALTSITGANVTGTVANATYATSTNTATTATTVTGAAQGNITSVGILTNLSVTGNVIGTNLYGTLQTATQLNVTGLGTLTTLIVSGNTTSGNLLSGGLISVAGNVTGGNINTAGQVSAAGNVTGGNILGGANVNATTHTGTTVSVTGNITGGNLSGTSIVGTLTTAAQTNITSVGTLGSLAVTGNITSGNLSGTSIVGTLTTAAQTNITSVGTLTSLSVTGNITGGNLTTAGTMTAATVTETSSVALKENFRLIDDPLEKILQLIGQIYDRKDGSNNDEVGLVAEDVFKIIPNLVKTDAAGNPESVYYSRLSVYLLEAVKALYREVKNLKAGK